MPRRESLHRCRARAGPGPWNKERCPGMLTPVTGGGPLQHPASLLVNLVNGAEDMRAMRTRKRNTVV